MEKFYKKQLTDHFFRYIIDQTKFHTCDNILIKSRWRDWPNEASAAGFLMESTVPIPASQRTIRLAWEIRMRRVMDITSHLISLCRIR